VHDLEAGLDVMVPEHGGAPNVTQAVPFFTVKDMDASLRFYVDGLGFTITNRWEPEGRLRWVTALVDPDGYRLEFESPTDVPEETIHSDDQ
jgi:catechol 2,3-dioxygenase-like lactoylglutathione lyase family enzyme